MKWKRCTKHLYTSIHIKLNTYYKNRAAILTNGIAAIFYSTGLYIFVIAFTNIFNILFARVSAFRQARAFLFKQ